MPAWDHEPDRKHWIDQTTGLDCLIVRNAAVTGALCGYVGVPKGHPWYGKEYGEIDAHVHGGLTYAANCSDDICHGEEEGDKAIANKDVWWIGFDCAHAGDFAPRLNRLLSFVTDDKYRDMAYVEVECQNLAQQVRKVA